MRKLSIRIAAVFAALAAAAPAAATNGMRVIGFGPIQNSMGGASVAAPLDSSVVVTNPAGLTSLDRRADLGGSMFTPTVKYDAAWTPDGATVLQASQSSDRAPDFIPTAGAVYKATDDLVVGVAALGIAGLGVDYAQSGGLYGSTTLTSYSNFRLAPGVGYRLSDRVSVGVTANLMYAWMKYSVAGAMGMAPRDTAYSMGYGATVGATFKLPEGVTFAAAYETKSTFQDFEFKGQNGTEKLAFDQPDLATVGAAFRPIQPLLVAVDLQWIHWSSTNGKNQPQIDQAALDSMPFDMNWANQTVVKVGAQYDVNKQIQVRAGYNYGSEILDASRAFENVAFPAIAKHHFTAGAGYAFGGITVNAALQYAPNVKVAGGNPAQGIPSYEIQMQQLAFDLGASWKF